MSRINLHANLATFVIVSLCLFGDMLKHFLIKEVAETLGCILFSMFWCCFVDSIGLVHWGSEMSALHQKLHQYSAVLQHTPKKCVSQIYPVSIPLTFVSGLYCFSHAEYPVSGSLMLNNLTGTSSLSQEVSCGQLLRYIHAAHKRIRPKW